MILPEINSERWLDLADFPKEEWRIIEDSPAYGTYLVSNYGRVKRLPFNGGRYHFSEQIFRIHRNRDKGYYKVRVGRKMYFVHRLVALAFVPRDMGELYVDHINCDKSDNRVCNLRWTTARGNIRNPISKWERRGRVGERPAPKMRKSMKSRNYNPTIRLSEGIISGTLKRAYRKKSD